MTRYHIEVKRKATFPIKLTPRLHLIYVTSVFLLVEISLLVFLEMGIIAGTSWLTRVILIIVILGTAAPMRGVNRVWADDQKVIVQNVLMPHLRKEIRWKDMRKVTQVVRKRKNTTPPSFKLLSISLETENQKIIIKNYYDKGLNELLAALRSFKIKVGEDTHVYTYR